MSRRSTPTAPPVRQVHVIGGDGKTLELRVPGGVPASAVWALAGVSGAVAVFLALPTVLGQIAGLVALALALWRPRDWTVAVWLVMIASGLLAQQPWSQTHEWWEAGLQVAGLVLTVPVCVLAQRAAANLPPSGVVGREVLAQRWGTLWRAQLLVQPFAAIGWWPRTVELPWLALLAALAALALGAWLLLRTGDVVPEEVERS